jgi:hypothetical protein
LWSSLETVLSEKKVFWWAEKQHQHQQRQQQQQQQKQKQVYEKGGGFC